MSKAKKARPAPASAGEESTTPYVVGIDLGTTNCAVAYIDTELEERVANGTDLG